MWVRTYRHLTRLSSSKRKSSRTSPIAPPPSIHAQGAEGDRTGVESSTQWKIPRRTTVIAKRGARGARSEYCASGGRRRVAPKMEWVGLGDCRSFRHRSMPNCLRRCSSRPSARRKSCTFHHLNYRQPSYSRIGSQLLSQSTRSGCPSLLHRRWSRCARTGSPQRPETRKIRFPSHRPRTLNCSRTCNW